MNRESFPDEYSVQQMLSLALSIECFPFIWMKFGEPQNFSCSTFIVYGIVYIIKFTV